MSNTAPFNQPLSGNDMLRFGGGVTMARLPQQNTAEGLDACFVGIPMGIGTSNRTGTRHGPRAIRAESAMMRPYNMATGAGPFAKMQVAEIGDVAIHTFDLKKTVDIITAAYDRILQHDVVPLTLGGGHTLTYPVLRAIARKHGVVALVHINAHSDTNDEMLRWFCWRSAPVSSRWYHGWAGDPGHDRCPAPDLHAPLRST